MNLDEMYPDPKQMELNESEFDKQIDDIIYSTKIKNEIKEETSGTTNIIVTKFADSSSDILDDEPDLELSNKEKIIELELLPSSLRKNKYTTLINGAVIKKSLKIRGENIENKKYSLNGVKKKRFRHSFNFMKECDDTPDLISNSTVDENNPNEIIECTLCNQPLASASLLKKHLETCKAQALGNALCSKCGKKFSSNYNLKRHMTSCKLCPDNEKSPRFMCQCGRTYSQEWDMKKHKLKCKEGKKKCKHCLMPNCNLLFYHKAQLIAHMKKDHNMIIQDPKILTFGSFDAFLSWKEKEEEETFTYYSKQTGSNVSGVSVNTYYVCQHDGSDRTHTSAPRKTERRNKKGRIKTGRLCWSQMNVKQFKDGTVQVTYFPSHTHPVSISDMEHHPLPNSITNEIKRRFSEITKLSETEETQSDDNSEIRRGKKKRFGMSLRTLRALARKNRSLFRITAEAMQKTDDDCPDPLTTFHFSPSNGLANDNVMQVFVTDPEEENVDDPDPTLFFNIGHDNNLQNNNEKLLEDCISYLNDVKNHLLSGKLPQAIVVQVKESLKNVCDLWKGEVENSILKKSEVEEEMMYSPQSPLPVTEMFPLQEDINPNLELNDDLKRLEETPPPPPTPSVYQIISVNGEQKTGNEYLYPNSVEMMGTRQFLIIAGDHAQLLQTIDTNITLGLN